MSKMLDTYESQVVAYQARNLKKMGYSSVGLYLFTTSAFKQKLTRDIASTISNAGLYIVSVFENGNPTQLGYFTSSRAFFDGVNATLQAKLIGQPKGSTIYFAVDGDIAQSGFPLLAAYFKAVRVLVQAAGYKVGVYGSGAVCSYLTVAGLVSKTWLSGSTGWSGYDSWKIKCDILQGETTKILGMDCDIGESTNGAGGGWMRV